MYLRNNPPKVSHESIRLRARTELIHARTVARLASVISLKDAVQVGLDRRSGRVRDHTVDTRELAHPFTITSASSDISNFLEIIRYKAYNLPDEVRRRLDGKPIVDIGAFIGVSAARLATQLPDSRITAIEPLPRNHSYLVRNAAPYGDQIEAVNGVFLAETTPGLRIIKDAGHSALMPLFMPGASADSPAIRQLTPGNLVGELEEIDEIGILKVDIEGAERDIFASPDIGPLLDRVNVLLIETHERFVPGCEAAVQKAVADSGLGAVPLNQHTLLFSRAA